MQRDSVRLDLTSYRRPGQEVWDLPPWNHPISQGVYPLFVRVQDHLQPIGTAFCISRYGLIATAQHCVYEALRWDPLASCKRGAGEHTLEGAGLSVLHHYLQSDGSTRFTILPIGNVSGPVPGDAAFGSLPYSAGLPLLSLKLSPAIPPPGSRALTVGYCEFRCPSGGVSIADVEAGQFDWSRSYSHTLRVSEGLIKAIFIHRFIRGFGDGPCLWTTSDTIHGQSGGPVFNENGHVSAIHWTGTGQLLGVPGSLGSLLYSSLAVNVKAAMQFNESVSMSVIKPLFRLLQDGSVLSDGSEGHHRIVETPDGIRVDPGIKKASGIVMYDDLAAFNAARPSA